MPKRVSALLLSIALLSFASCATRQPQAYCVGEPYPITLSPSHRAEEGLRLVSISSSRRVAVRLTHHKDGLAFARPGEEFTLRDGTTAPGFYRLRSVDPATDRVVIEGISFAMMAPR